MTGKEIINFFYCILSSWDDVIIRWAPWKDGSTVLKRLPLTSVISLISTLALLPLMTIVDAIVLLWRLPLVQFFARWQKSVKVFGIFLRMSTFIKRSRWSSVAKWGNLSIASSHESTFVNVVNAVFNAIFCFIQFASRCSSLKLISFDITLCRRWHWSSTFKV